MRILLNALVVKRGGHRTYFHNFIPYFGKFGIKHDFVLLYSPWQKDIFDFELPENFTRAIIGPDNRSVFKKVVWEQITLPEFLKREAIDLMFSPTPVTTFYSPCPIVIAIRNTNLFMRLKIKDLRYQIRNLTLMMVTKFTSRRATRVIFVSYFSRNEAVKVLGIDAANTKVIYHGIGEQFIKRSSCSSNNPFEESRPYILTVSIIHKHKNYIRLLKAFAELCVEDDLGYDIVFAGGVEAKEDFDKLVHMTKLLDIEERVHFLGEIPYQDLPALYHGATIFVMPSLLESFGHPLVEAMASGVPIVASNTTAIPEICGDAAIYFDPLSVDQMANSMRFVLLDESIREQLIQVGFERARIFSWADTAQQMLDLFEDAISK